MSKTCLVVIYNHQFTGNIEKIEKLYGDRFDKIFHVMPFYTGDRENVVSVYENSYQFSGYVTQAMDKFYSDEYDYFAFMGDDVMLHPDFSKDTIEDMLKINADTGFTARNLFTVNDGYILTRVWLFPTLLNYMYSDNKDMIDDILPDIQTMVDKYKQLGINCSLISEEKIKYLQDYLPVNSGKNFFYKYQPSKLDENLDFKKLLAAYENERKQKGKPIKYLFPFAGGFSDFFVIPKKYIKKFGYYAGVLASERFFAEVAVPTALCISLDKISLPKDINMKVINYTSGDSARKELPEKYNKSVKAFLADWDNNNLLVHPIKYSIWEMDIEK